MSNKETERLIYYKGQTLTAQDFQDQQEYHIEKLKQIVERFPRGIIRGLDVVFDARKDFSTDDFDAFKITAGLAVDATGNPLVVPEEGLRVDIAEFTNEKPYLSLVYSEEVACASHSVCDSPSKNNRIKERVIPRWTQVPNVPANEAGASDQKGRPVITVARIRLKDKSEKDKRNEKFGENHVIIVDNKDDQLGRPTIRLDASVIQAAQLAKNSISEEKIEKNAVTHDKIKDEAVTQEKLAPDVKLPPTGPARGDLWGDYPNPAIGDEKITEPKIASSAVTTSKIHNAAVTTDKILDKAVTSEKLSVVTVNAAGKILGEGKLEESTTFTFPDDDKLRIPQVIPIKPPGSQLSCSYVVERTKENKIKYIVTISRVLPERVSSAKDAIDYKLLLAELG